MMSCVTTLKGPHKQIRHGAEVASFSLRDYSKM